MINVIDFNSIKALMNASEMEIEEKHNIILSWYDSITNKFEGELKPIINELKDKINIASLELFIENNPDKHIKTGDYREIYGLLDFNTFSNIISTQKENFIHNSKKRFEDNTLKMSIFKSTEPITIYSDMFESKSDIKSYIQFLFQASNIEFGKLDKKDGYTDNLCSLLTVLYSIYTYTEVYYVLSTLHNASTPILSNENYVFCRKYGMSNESIVFSYEDKNSEEEDFDDDKPESDDKNDTKGNKKEEDDGKYDESGEKDEDDGDEEEDKKGFLSKLKGIGQATVKFFGKVRDGIVAIPRKLSLLQRKIKLFQTNRKNLKVYKRYRGKFESLYKEYGDKCGLEENNMRDDPVRILHDVAAQYITNLGKRMCELADEVQELAKKMEQTHSFEKRMALAKEYAKLAPTRDEDGKEIDEDNMGKRIYLATKRRIAQILLDSPDFSIYGFTEQSMTVGKIPPANHLIVSIFVANPFQTPTKQDVKDIIKSPESFEMMSSADKNKFLSVNELANAVMRNSITSKTFKNIEENRKNQFQNFKKMLKNAASDKNSELKKRLKKEQKVMKKIMNGISQSVKTMASMKMYMMDCINMYFSMIIRIDNLVYNCLMALIECEKEHLDIRYNPHMGAGKSDASNVEMDRIQNPEKYEEKTSALDIANQLNNNQTGGVKSGRRGFRY